jgi:hypothetical protein
MKNSKANSRVRLRRLRGQRTGLTPSAAALTWHIVTSTSMELAGSLGNLLGELWRQLQ